MEYYCFEIPLPYSIRVPTQENIEFLFGGQQCCLVHLERAPIPNGKFEFPHTSFIPADKYGLYFKSRIVLVLSCDIVKKIWAAESDEIQKIFPDLDSFVGLLFGNPASSLKDFVFATVNHFLGIYRVISQDWHVTELMPKDVPHIVIRKQKDGVTTFLTLCMMGEQIMFVTGHDVLPIDLMKILRAGLSSGGKMNPLAALEADIHEKATQGDLLMASILIGLLVEEAIKEHIIQFLKIKNQWHYDEAKKELIKDNGKYLGIGDLLDKKKNNNERCFIERLIDWKPYESNEYGQWDKNVRDVRNEIIHAGRKDINSKQVELAWVSCIGFLRLLRNKFLHALIQSGIRVSENEALRFFSPLASEIFPRRIQ